MATTRSTNYRNKLIISTDLDESLKITQKDGTELVAIDNTAAPVTFATFQMNGFKDMAGSGAQRAIIQARASIGSGTQSGRLRGFDTVIRGQGTAVQAGVDGNAFRALNASVAWNSTGTAAELVGLNDTVLIGGGAITAGNVTVAACNRVRFGFQSVDFGSITDAYGYWVEAPKEVDADHTIVNSYGIFMDDQEATGITNAYAIKTGTGLVQFGGRFLGKQGADVASAANLTLGTGGGVFEITGTTQINLIDSTGWTNGSQITLLFTANPTVKDGQVTTGSNVTILLAGTVDFIATAGSTLTLTYAEIGGTPAWREISRMVR